MIIGYPNKPFHIDQNRWFRLPISRPPVFDVVHKFLSYGEKSRSKSITKTQKKGNLRYRKVDQNEESETLKIFPIDSGGETGASAAFAYEKNFESMPVSIPSAIPSAIDKNSPTEQTTEKEWFFIGMPSPVKLSKQKKTSVPLENTAQNKVFTKELNHFTKQVLSHTKSQSHSDLHNIKQDPQESFLNRQVTERDKSLNRKEQQTKRKVNVSKMESGIHDFIDDHQELIANKQEEEMYQQNIIDRSDGSDGSDIIDGSDENKALLLSKAYETETLQDKDFLWIKRDILLHFQVDDCAFLLWDKEQFAYHILLNNEKKDTSTLRNFFLLEKDAFFDQQASLQSWDNNTFVEHSSIFDKRIDQDFLRTYQKIYILQIPSQIFKGASKEDPKEDSGKPTFLLLFCLKSKNIARIPDKRTINTLMQKEKFLSFLKESIPLLQHYRETLWHNTISDTNLNSFEEATHGILSNMREYANAEDEKFCVLHFQMKVLTNKFDEQDGDEKLKSSSDFSKKLEKIYVHSAEILYLLSNTILPTERMFVHSMGRLLLLLRETTPNEIITLTRELCEKEDMLLYFNLSEFPKQGHNFYSYIETII